MNSSRSQQGNAPIKSVVILGGGTAGWSAAAGLKRFLHKRQASVTLVESSKMGTVGVGEASLPNLRNFNAYVGLSEQEFIARTGATFKLGIRFDDWAKRGKNFFHPFGAYGVELEDIAFHQCLYAAQRQGYQGQLDEYSLPIALAKSLRFSQPSDRPQSPLSQFGYAYHFDAARYAAALKDIAVRNGVETIDAFVSNVKLDPENGFIEALALDTGQQLTADLFIDCSGFSALLIEQALETGYESWQRWLPCDRAVAMQCEHAASGGLTPFTVARARDAGWTWRIPLQERVGNGLVYSSAHMSDATAEYLLTNSLEGAPITGANKQRFTGGMRRKFWNRNCIALGLASGFIEPLESTSINLVHRGLSILMDHFPGTACDERLSSMANRAFAGEQERIRDFIVLHYWLSNRTDTEFWNDIRSAGIPVSLADKIDAFRANGTLLQDQYESFRPESWLTMYHGFGVTPETLDTRIQEIEFPNVMAGLETMRQNIKNAALQAPDHAEVINRHFRPLQPAISR